MTTNNNPTAGLTALIAAHAGAWKQALLVLALAGSAVLAYSWLKAHDAWTRFQTESHLKDQQIAQRDQQAAADRAAIKQLKQRTQTPQQIAAALPQVIRLPQRASAEYPKPGTQYSVPTSQYSEKATVIPRESRDPCLADDRRTLPNASPADDSRPATHDSPGDLPSGPPPALCFPPVDAKPLFDRLADCNLTEASLATCQANFADMKRERDAAVRARKGSFWQRAKQIGIGLAIGTALGYAAHR